MGRGGSHHHCSVDFFYLTGCLVFLYCVRVRVRVRVLVRVNGVRVHFVLVRVRSASVADGDAKTSFQGTVRLTNQKRRERELVRSSASARGSCRRTSRRAGTGRSGQDGRCRNSEYSLFPGTARTHLRSETLLEPKASLEVFAARAASVFVKGHGKIYNTVVP